MSADIEKIVGIGARALDPWIWTDDAPDTIAAARTRSALATARIIHALTAAGYAIVPREPSAEMARAGAMAAPVAGEYREHGYMLSDYGRIYSAMIEAFSPAKG